MQQTKPNTSRCRPRAHAHTLADARARECVCTLIKKAHEIFIDRMRNTIENRRKNVINYFGEVLQREHNTIIIINFVPMYLSLSLSLGFPLLCCEPLMSLSLLTYSTIDLYSMESNDATRILLRCCAFIESHYIIYSSWLAGVSVRTCIHLFSLPRSLARLWDFFIVLCCCCC